MKKVIIVPSIAVMGLDWGIQHFGIKESTNRRRLITGISCGTALTYVYYYAFKAIKNKITETKK